MLLSNLDVLLWERRCPLHACCLHFSVLCEQLFNFLCITGIMICYEAQYVKSTKWWHQNTDDFEKETMAVILLCHWSWEVIVKTSTCPWWLLQIWGTEPINLLIIFLFPLIWRHDPGSVFLGFGLWVISEKRWYQPFKPDPETVNILTLRANKYERIGDDLDFR